jgi:carbon-monoxide dehydrogenase small subunit
MSRIVLSLIVNGEPTKVEAEPRDQLADLLRDRLMLTGTHVGCEHGVCGACTVEIDGAPARSCITHAGGCDGASIRTVEGFGEDAVMAALREAFSQEHALQCGYCTPGMLVVAGTSCCDFPMRMRPSARGDGRQFVPLHRLSRHRARGVACSDRTESGRQTGVKFSAQARKALMNGKFFRRVHMMGLLPQY